MPDETLKRPIIFGEVLFDCFPDGERVMGGAPFNVAWHLQGFGLKPVLISAIGDDENGRLLEHAMSDWGMDCRGLQVDKQHATGQVSVRLQNGQPSFEIMPDQAYDFINAEEALHILQDTPASVFYHGSLALRTPSAHQRFIRLAKNLPCPSFIDVNLRPPWWNFLQLNEYLQMAQWAKLNDEELRVIARQLVLDEQDILALAKHVFQHYTLTLLIVTLGEHGAIMISDQGLIKVDPVKANVVDTVGAGDSFSAVMIMGLLQQWPLQHTLQCALQFAAKICEQKGATSQSTQLYELALTQWKNKN